MDLFNRIIDLKMGDLEFENSNINNPKGFDISFRIPFEAEDEPDVSEISIYNLKDETINSIRSKGYVILNAGYEGQVGNLLSGKIEHIDTIRRGLDKETRITVTDGGIEFRNSQINKTYKEDVNIKYIMNELALTAGFEVGEIDPVNNITFPLGKSVNGYIEPILKELAKSSGSKMYIKNNRIFIRDKDKGTETGFVLDSGSGLLDSPEIQREEKEDGQEVLKYRVKCYLNHNINKDSIVKVVSKDFQGFLRVESGEHSGDSFETSFIGIPI